MLSPTAGAVWETFVFAQLRHRERRAGRTNSLFFWRDRTREVDFVVDMAGRVELYETKWSELPSSRDAVNLEFLRRIFGKSRVLRGAVICRAGNSYPLENDLQALSVNDITG
jgi:hypothetical protein